MRPLQNHSTLNPHTLIELLITDKRSSNDIQAKRHSQEKH